LGGCNNMKQRKVLKYNPHLLHLARNNRKNMTIAERKLWARIRKKQLNGHKFLRQRPIGNYIVDFYCPKAKIVIELDGEQHYSEKGLIRDKERDAYLNSLGLNVLRFSNNDIKNNIDIVLDNMTLPVVPLKGNKTP